MPKKLSESDLIEHTTQLLEDFELHSDAEFFSDSVNRVEFLSLLDYDDFFGITQHINARVRGFEPRDKHTVGERGAHLPMLATPKAEEKQEALRAGFHAIQSYLRESNDVTEEKIRGVGMAVEALIIWVHPFNDGNGRTSRFLGKFIEDGTTDVDQLIEETTSHDTRLREYGGVLRIDSGNLYKNADLVSFDDDDIKKLEETEMPIADGISLSLTRLLEDKSYQDRVDAKTARYRASLAEYTKRRASAA